MNDPHVEALHYRVEPGDHVDYNKAEPVIFKTDEFSVKVNSQQAIFEMKAHYSNQDDARAVVESFLRRWEVLIGLQHHPGNLRFTFQRADVIDRAPSESDRNVLNVQSTIHIQASLNAVLHVSRGSFPPAPARFNLSPDVETMYMRYKAFREGRESLLSMAYMCLTVLEASVNGRVKAAKTYSIESPVLDKLGELCSERGAPSEARKTPKSGQFVALSAQEKEWVIQVIKAIIRRVGEYAFDSASTLPQITMSDFPKL